jgi:hypothetical protein
MKFSCFAVVFCGTFLFFGILDRPVSAQSGDSSSAGSSLTIYNGNFAVVRNTIPLDLKDGINHVSYTGITAQVEPDSVILRDPKGKTNLSVVEQNYRGDTVSQGFLLSLNERKTIDFRVPGVDGGAPTIVEGKIIRSGYSPSQRNNDDSWNDPSQPTSDDTPLVEVDGKLQFGLPGLPLFPELGTDSILRPTFEWTIDSNRSGTLNAELAYITEGFNWLAAYDVVEPETGSTIDITAWVTIDNESGEEFDNAKIKLMAGDVNKLAPQPEELGARATTMGAFTLATTATQKAFDEYHLYTLPNATTLRNHETKQVQFLHASNVSSQEVYVYDGANIDPDQYSNSSYDNIRNDRDYGTDSNDKVTIEQDFDNTAANGLGVPLPAGRIRFYRKDHDGQIEFIGENDIDHTPKDEPVKIVTGEAFDLVGSRTQTDYTVDVANARLDESFLITLKNHKSTMVNVKVVEHLYRSLNWTITASSGPFVKVDSKTISFNVPIGPNAQKQVTYTAHYTW